MSASKLLFWCDTTKTRPFGRPVGLWYNSIYAIYGGQNEGNQGETSPQAVIRIAMVAASFAKLNFNAHLRARARGIHLREKSLTLARFAFRRKLWQWKCCR